MNEIEVEIDALSLDLENARFNGFKSGREALAGIVADQGPKLLELVKDIATEGLSPANRIIAIPGATKKKFVVVDGNRRLASLKILINPAVVDSFDGISAALKKQFKEAAKNFDRSIIEPISIALISNRDEANRWIDLIHTGENKGRGVVAWDGVATDRFRGRSPAYQVLQLLHKAGALTNEQVEKFPITNLGRLLGTPEVRAAFGITIEDSVPKLLFPTANLIPLLSYVADELVSGRTKVSQLITKDDRLNFARNLPKRFLPKSVERLDTPVSLEDALRGVSASSIPAKKTASSHAILRIRKQLIPRRCKLSIDNARVEHVAFELRRLDVNSTPNAVAVLFRVFLELSMDAYGKKNKLSGYSADSLNLQAKLLKVADDLQAKGMSRNELHSFRRAANNSGSSLHVDRLHKFVHGLNSLPTPGELLSGWDEVQPVFEQIWK